MRSSSPRPRVTRRAVAAALGSVVALSGCSLIGADETPEPATSAEAAVEDLVDSQFTQDGTFQSHISARGLSDVDFVYTLYPTKSTPRTNEWYPRGNKFFSFTFQAYDLARDLRDPFATKRKAYLDTIKVTSTTITVDGTKSQQPYRLDEVASEVTFDPEPVTTRYGMLITSPKGAFELRNQRIKPTDESTRGIELTFEAVVHVPRRVGSDEYVNRTITQVVPIAIFESDEPTQPTSIPVDAN